MASLVKKLNRVNFKRQQSDLEDAESYSSRDSIRKRRTHSYEYTAAWKRAIADISGL